MSTLGELFAASTSISDFRNPELWMYDGMGVQRTSAGESITPQKAFGLSAFYTCIRSISEDVAKLPLITYRRTGERGKKQDKEHPAHRILLNRPNPNMTAMSFKETIIHHALGFGNGYAEIQFSQFGDPIALWPIHPSRVNIKNRLFQESGRSRRSITYEVWNDDGTRVGIPQRRMLHLHGLSMDGMRGYSILRLAAESIGLARSVELFGNSFFNNGTHLVGAVKHPTQISDQAFDHLRKSWKDTYAGPANAHGFAILEEGMDWVKMGVEPEAAQFLETRTFSVEDMARWFRMPLQKVGVILRGGSSSGGRSEKGDVIQMLYLNETLMPWMVRFEEECDRKFFDALDDVDAFAKFLVRASMRGSPDTVADIHSKYFHIGVMSQNDIAEEIDLNPLPNGDTRYVPVNLVPDHLAKDGMGGRPSNEEKSRQPEGDQDSTDDRREDRDRQRDQGAPPSREQAFQSMRPVFVDAFERLIRKEHQATARAAKKHAGDYDSFKCWVDQFVATQVAMTEDLFRSPFSALFSVARVNAGDDLEFGSVSHGMMSIVDAYTDEFTMVALQQFREDASKVGDTLKAFNVGRVDRLVGLLEKEFHGEAMAGAI